MELLISIWVGYIAFHIWGIILVQSVSWSLAFWPKVDIPVYFDKFIDIQFQQQLLKVICNISMVLCYRS